MRIPVKEAEARLTELARRAGAGEEVILTVPGNPDIQLTPVKKKNLDPEAWLAAIEAIQASAATKATHGPSAARSQDFLYDEDGLPA